MRRTYKYRAVINKKTETNCEKWLYLCRTLYNLVLEQRIWMYRQRRETPSHYDQQNQLPEFKNEFTEFKDVGSQVLQNVTKRVDLAYRAFFRRLKSGQGKAGFPRFKGKNRYDSFTFPNRCGWKLEGRYLYVKKVGRFKLHPSKPVQGDIKTVTVRRSPTGKWYVCFSCDNVVPRKFPKATEAIGIDVGIKSFCVDSDGNVFDNPKYYRESEQLLRKRQRKLSRRKKGSVGRKEARILVAKAHERVFNLRNDFLHKTANYYIENYGTINIEDLQVRNMLKNKHLSKSIADASWSKFFDMLTYKAEEAGREVVKVRPHGTSQLCSFCGAKVPKTLAVRVHRCSVCGLVMDRDHNAALNILNCGQVGRLGDNVEVSDSCVV